MRRADKLVLAAVVALTCVMFYGMLRDAAACERAGQAYVTRAFGTFCVRVTAR